MSLCLARPFRACSLLFRTFGSGILVAYLILPTSRPRFVAPDIPTIIPPRVATSAMHWLIAFVGLVRR